MTQALAQQQQEVTPRARLHAAITDEQQLAEFKAALPENVSVDKFRRALSTAINEKPELVEVFEENPRSLFSALTKCASFGLLPDGRQAAINVYKTKQKDADGKDVWLKTAQFLPMKDGLRHVLAQYGWTLTSRVVYTNDEFEWTEAPATLTHRVARGDRGELEYVWTTAVHRDGRYIQRVLDKDRVMKSKAKAKTTKIWDEWEDEMWEKTGDHAIFDDVPLDESERDRIKALLASEGLLADPVAALYRGDTRPALEASVPPDEAATPAAPGGGGDGSPQAAAPLSPSGAAVPGDQAEFDWSAAPPAEPTPAAGDTVLPDAIPTFGGQTVSQVAETDLGRAYLLWALSNAPAGDPTRMQIETYVRAEQPELWEQHQAAGSGT